MVQPKSAVMLHVRLTADKVTRYANVLDKSMPSCETFLTMKTSDATRAL